MLMMASVPIALAQAAAPAAGQGSEPVHTDRTVRFNQIDKNGDGKLSLQEFLTRPSNQVPAPKVDATGLANRTARFKKVDKNGDGFLIFEEFKMLETIPMAGSPAK